MNDFLIENQFMILLIGLILIPLLILLLFLLLGRKNHDLIGRIVMGIAAVYIYDTMLLGISLFMLLFKTGNEYFILAAVGIVPLIIGIAVVLACSRKYTWAGVGARIIVLNVVYFLAVFYFLAMIMGITSGMGKMLIILPAPVLFGIVLYVILRRNYIIITTDVDEIVFLKEDYDETEAYDYINHLQ